MRVARADGDVLQLPVSAHRILPADDGILAKFHHSMCIRETPAESTLRVSL
jgi:hypothetical protein